MLKRNNTRRFADNHALDKFYLEFENRFRGTEEGIKEKTVFYAELLKRAGLPYAEYPIIDVGCGRGELLSILKQYGLNAIGLDINKAMVRRAKQNGMNAVQGDAIKYLKSQRPESVGAVTGMQLIEHIPFPELMELFEACYQALRTDGLVVFETPNPENLNVGSYSFYMDPSHLHPLPPPLIGYALESVGFTDVEIIYRNDSKPDRKRYDDPMLDELSNRLYGPLDYAAVAYKRARKQTKASNPPAKNPKKK